MRARFIAAVAVLAGTGLVPGAAAAEEPAALEVPSAADGSAAEVRLPSGDTVGIAPDGTLDPGGEGAFAVGKNADGERLVVPLDAIDEVAAGEHEAEEFNVDSHGGVLETEPAAETTVTLTGEWLDGSAPEVIGVSWTKVGSPQGGIDYFEGGTAELALEPGRYHLITLLVKDVEDDEGDVIAAIQQVRVGENPVGVLIDGTKARPLGFDLDRETESESVQLDLFSRMPNAEEGDGAWLGFWAQPGGDLYAVPSPRLTGGNDVGYVVRQGLASAEGTPDPYSYSLLRDVDGGFRGDLTPPVHDADLARIDADYRTLGAEGTFTRQDLPELPGYMAGFYTNTGDVALPSSRTEFYSTDEGLSWEHRAYFPYEGGPGSAWDLVHHRSGVLAPGSVQAMTWNNAPLSVGIDDNGQDWPPGTFVRWDEYEMLYFAPWMFSSSTNGEGVHSEYLPGKITLFQNGEVLAQNSVIGLAVGTSDVTAGELTLAVAADREAAWTPLGTRSEAEWTFDYDPAGDPALPVSVVEFAASGVVNGYAEAGTVQEFELEFAQQSGADDQDCAAMTFDVSFDDGATWTPVALDREGDTATASLELPAEPGFVSVRFTAADEAGNTVAHETIRSYGLR